MQFNGKLTIMHMHLNICSLQSEHSLQNISRYIRLISHSADIINIEFFIYFSFKQTHYQNIIQYR